MSLISEFRSRRMPPCSDCYFCIHDITESYGIVLSHKRVCSRVRDKITGEYEWCNFARGHRGCKFHPCSRPVDAVVDYEIV